MDWVEWHDAQYREEATKDREAVGRFVGSVVKPLERLVAQLQDRIAQLEHRLENQTYRGNYVEGVQYHEGNMVTLGGSCWIANCDTTERPTTHTHAWALMVKRGRDAPRSPSHRSVNG